MTTTSTTRLRMWVLSLLALPVVALAQQAYTNRTVNVRAGPATDYPVVAQLGAGAPMQVLGCLDDWSWCDIQYADLRGWVYAPYLNYVYRGYRVPLYTYAPSLGIPIISFALGPYWDRYYYGRPWYGRRDYWISRPPPPHYRPPGPPPRPVPPPPRPRPPVQIQPVPPTVPSTPGMRPPPPQTRPTPQAEAPQNPRAPTVMPRSPAPSGAAPGTAQPPVRQSAPPATGSPDGAAPGGSVIPR